MFNTPISADTDGSLRALAESIASGTTVMLPKVERELFDFGQWQEAADLFLIGDDPCDLQHMLAREEAWNEFTGDPDDFGNWLSRKAMWDQTYARAMTLAERGTADFATIARGHRAFARQGRAF